MLNVLEYLAVFEAERTLILTYNVGLAFFESQVREHLQKGRVGRVLILADWRQWTSAFREAAALRQVGSSYQIQPIVLPGRQCAAHAKLYLQAGRSGLRALVSSANLTASGVKRNAELADEVSLTHSRGHIHAFARIDEILAFLTETHPLWPSRAKVEIDWFRDQIAALSRTAANIDGGPELFHSIQEPILGQLLRRVDTKEVKRLTVISPFFDPKGRALRELLQAAPKARLRLVKSEGRQNLDGAALADLSRRISVEALTSVGTRRRRLHGKLIAFHGKKDSLIVSGSANATVAALLRAVKHDTAPGNLELSALRSLSEARTKNDLLLPMHTRELDLTDCVCVDPDDESEPGENHLLLWSAELTGHTLTIVCNDATPSLAGKTAAISIETSDVRSVVEGELQLRLPGVLSLHANLAAIGISDFDRAAVVTIALTANGQAYRGRAWLVRPDLLALSAEERRRRVAVDEIMEGSATGTTFEFVSSCLAAFGGALESGGSSATAAPPSPATTDTNPRNDERERVYSLDDLRVAEDDLRNTRRRSSPSTLRSLDELLRPTFALFGTTAASGVGAQGALRGRRRRGSDDVGDDDDFADDDLDEDLARRTRVRPEYDLVHRALGHIDRLIADMSAAPVDQERIAAVARASSAAMGTVVARFYARFVNADPTLVPGVLSAWGNVLRRMWSLDDVFGDAPQGWITRCLLTAPELTALQGDRELASTLRHHAAFLATFILIANSRRAGAPGGVYADLVIGFRVATSAIDVPADTHEMFDGEFDALCTNLDLPWTHADAHRALTVDPASVRGFRDAVGQWAALRDLAVSWERDAHGGQPADMPPRLAEMATRLRGRKTPICAQVLQAGTQSQCGECDSALSTELAHLLRANRMRVEACEGCGRILVPLDTEGRMAKAVMAIGQAAL